MLVSRQQAIAAERQHLVEYADWALKRGELNLTRAKEALVELEAEGWISCSPAHIARLRQATLDNRAVDELGFFRDGKLACTSWGLVTQDIDKGVPDERLPSGFDVSIGVRPEVSGAGAMFVVSHGSHNALIVQKRLVDVLTDSSMTLGVATAAGRVIDTTGPADPTLVRRLLTRDTAGSNDTHIYASRRSGDLIGFAIDDRVLVESRRQDMLGALLPVGLVGSAVLVGLILWVSRQRLSLRKELQVAIRRREFVAYYQPIIELSTGLCVGAEALIRWDRPDGSQVMPDVFVPAAEQSGLASDLTDCMIERVVADLAQMLVAERSVHIAINITADDMHSGRFLPVLAAALEKADVAPDQIWLEATERGFVHADQARATIEKARAAGHLVAIDDFGTGYSSLSLLEQLPLDALKIDKSFIEAIGKGAAKSVVTPHIIEMAHGLRFHVIAEGVETIAQEAYIRAAGVAFAQGYLYSKPLPADEFVAYYGRRNAGRLADFLKAVA